MNKTTSEVQAASLPQVPPEISIIVISYNTREMTLACLSSIYAETETPFEVIVVDNASTDGSAEAIAQLFPRVRLMAEKENHGFARAHSIALPEARSQWLLLLNPDTLVLNRALDKLVAFAKRTPDAGVWGGRTVYADGSLNPFSCWGRMTLWSLFCQATGLSALFSNSSIFNPEAYGGWKRDTEREVDIVTGCLLLTRRETWDQLGGFEPAFTMYGEEADMCLRGRAMGLRPRITPSASIVHYGGASEPVRADKMVRLLRAKMELIKRHFPSSSQTIACVLFQLWPLSRLTVFRLLAATLRNTSIREKSLVWAEVWRRRSEWQSGFQNTTTVTS